MIFYIDHFKYDVDKYSSGQIDVQLIISSGPNPTSASSVTLEVFKQDGSVAGGNELGATTDSSTFSDNGLVVTLTVGPDLVYFEEYTVRVNIDGNIGDFKVSFCGHEAGLDLIPYRHKVTSAVVNKPLMQLDQKVKHAFCKIENLESMIAADLEITNDPDEGEYVRASLDVTLSCNDAEALIYYGVYDPSDNTVPEQTADNVYTSPIQLTCPSGNTCEYVVRCYAVKGGVRSQIYEFNYRLVNEELAVTADPGSGTYSSTINVTLSCNDSTADIYYTLDGSDPDTSSTLYTGPISIGSDTTLKAKAYATDGSGRESSIATYTYVIQSGALTAYIHSSDGDQPTNITFTADKGGTDVTSGSDFYYTLDGSDPDTSSTLWDGNPINLDSNNDITVKVIAVYSGEQSAIASSVIGRRCPDGRDYPVLLDNGGNDPEGGNPYANGTTVQVRVDSLDVPCDGGSTTVNAGGTGFQLNGYDIRFKVYYKYGTSPTETDYDDFYQADGGLPTDYTSITGTDANVKLYAKVYIYRIDGTNEEYLNDSYASSKTITFGSATDDTIDISVSRGTPASADCSNLDCCGDADISFAPASGATCSTIEYLIESDNPSSTVTTGGSWVVGTSYHIDLEDIQGVENITIRARCQGSTNESTEYITMDNRLTSIIAIPGDGSSLTQGDSVTLQVVVDGVNYSGTSINIHYIVDGGTEQVVNSGSTTITFSSTGNHTIEYWITDATSNLYCGRIDTNHKTATYSVAADSFLVTIENPTNSSSEWNEDSGVVYAKRGTDLNVPITSDSSATIYYEEKAIGEACDDAATIESSNTYSGPLTINTDKKICAVAKIGSSYSDNIDSKEYRLVYAEYSSGASYASGNILVINGGTRAANGSCYDWNRPNYVDITFSGNGLNVASVSDVGVSEQFTPPCAGFSLVVDSIVSSSDTSVTIRFRVESPQECDSNNDGTQDRMKYDVSIPLKGGFAEVFEFQVRTGEDAYPGTSWCVYEVDEANSTVDYYTYTAVPLSGDSAKTLPYRESAGTCTVTCADGSTQVVPKWAGVSGDFTLHIKGSGITDIGSPSAVGTPAALNPGVVGSYQGYDSGSDSFIYAGTLGRECVVDSGDTYVDITVVVSLGDGTTRNVTFRIYCSCTGDELGCESC